MSFCTKNQKVFFFFTYKYLLSIHIIWILGYIKVADATNIKPSLLHLNQYETAKFFCKSSNFSVWFFEKTDAGYISRDNPLSLGNISLQNAGRYFCFGTYDDYKVNFLSVAELKVYSKSTIHIICTN